MVDSWLNMNIGSCQLVTGTRGGLHRIIDDRRTWSILLKGRIENMLQPLRQASTRIKLPYVSAHQIQEGFRFTFAFTPRLSQSQSLQMQM